MNEAGTALQLDQTTSKNSYPAKPETLPGADETLGMGQELPSVDVAVPRTTKPQNPPEMPHTLPEGEVLDTLPHIQDSTIPHFLPEQPIADLPESERTEILFKQMREKRKIHALVVEQWWLKYFWNANKGKKSGIDPLLNLQATLGRRAEEGRAILIDPEFLAANNLVGNKVREAAYHILLLPDEARPLIDRFAKDSVGMTPEDFLDFYLAKVPLDQLSQEYSPLLNGETQLSDEDIKVVESFVLSVVEREKLPALRQLIDLLGAIENSIETEEAKPDSNLIAQLDSLLEDPRFLAQIENEIYLVGGMARLGYDAAKTKYTITIPKLRANTTKALIGGKIVGKIIGRNAVRGIQATGRAGATILSEAPTVIKNNLERLRPKESPLFSFEQEVLGLLKAKKITDKEQFRQLLERDINLLVDNMLDTLQNIDKLGITDYTDLQDFFASTDFLSENFPKKTSLWRLGRETRESQYHQLAITICFILFNKIREELKHSHPPMFAKPTTNPMLRPHNQRHLDQQIAEEVGYIRDSLTLLYESLDKIWEVYDPPTTQAA